MLELAGRFAYRSSYTGLTQLPQTRWNNRRLPVNHVSRLPHPTTGAFIVELIPGCKGNRASKARFFCGLNGNWSTGGVECVNLMAVGKLNYRCQGFQQNAKYLAVS